jgi:hypothetical protein
MSMDTIISVDHIPTDRAEAERIAGALARLAAAFELSTPDISVWGTPDRSDGRVYLGCYHHEYELDGLDTLARIISRLLPGRDVRVEEEGHHDDYWARTATYRSGRCTRTGTKEWVEHDTGE